MITGLSLAVIQCLTNVAIELLTVPITTKKVLLEFVNTQGRSVPYARMQVLPHRFEI